MKRIIGLSLTLFFAATSPGLHAEGDRYQIELFVFEQGVQSTAISQQTESLIQWPTALTELSGIQQTEHKLLKDGAEALLTKPSYRQILHNAWVQTTGPGGAILPMHIKSEDGRLDGFIHLRNGQPFELIVDLEKQALQMDNRGKRYLYRIYEKRPVKMNELHYLDNPKFGVLVQINAI